MKTRVLISLMLALLFGAVANAAEKDKTVVATDNANVAKTTVNKDGPWIGIIEDIQHLDDTDKTELISKYEAAGIGAAAAIRIFTESTHSFLAYLLIKDSGSVGDQPKLYLITFKEANNNLKKVVVYDELKWNVGDRIEVTKYGDDVVVKTLEMGELSKYAAAQEAARSK